MVRNTILVQQNFVYALRAICEKNFLESSRAQKPRERALALRKFGRQNDLNGCKQSKNHNF